MEIEFLTREDIIQINGQTIAIHGGNFVPPDNLLNASALDYLIEVVGSDLFDQPMYTELWDKAAVYIVQYYL